MKIAAVGMTAGLVAGLAFGDLALGANNVEPAQQFQVRTNSTKYQPGEVATVSFRYRVEPGTSLATLQGGELGCNYFVTLENSHGDVVADAGSSGCSFEIQCDDNPSPIERVVSLAIPAGVPCGIYRIRVRTEYLRLSPDQPLGILEFGPETALPVVVCQDSHCPCCARPF